MPVACWPVIPPTGQFIALRLALRRRQLQGLVRVQVRPLGLVRVRVQVPPVAALDPAWVSGTRLATAP